MLRPCTEFAVCSTGISVSFSVSYGFVRLRPCIKRRRKRRRRGMDGKVRAVHPAELLGARMHVHEGLPRRRNVEDGVALRRQLAEPPADQQNEIGGLGARDEFRIGAVAELARVTGMQRIKQMRAPE